VHIPVRRLIEGEHAQRIAQINGVRRGIIRAALREVEIAGPDQPVAFRAVCHVRERAREQPTVEPARKIIGQQHASPGIGDPDRVEERPSLFRREEAHAAAREGSILGARDLCTVKPHRQRRPARLDLQPVANAVHQWLGEAAFTQHAVASVLPRQQPHRTVEPDLRQVCVARIRRAERQPCGGHVIGIGAQLEGRLDAHIAPRRAIAAQSDLFGLLKLARQQPTVHALPGVMIRKGSDLQRPRADRPQPIQTLVAAQEKPVVRRTVIHLAVHHRHGVDGDLGAGGVKLKPNIPGLALNQRCDETPGTRHGIGLVPVDIPRQHRQIKRLAEVTGTGRTREAASF